MTFASRLAFAMSLPLAFVSVRAFAGIFTVGSDASCTHGTIQSAIDAADASSGYDVIRLTRSLTYEPEANTVVTDQDLSIVGGFENCDSSASDGFKTVVSGGNVTGQPVFRIQANGIAIIKIRLLSITQGNTADAGGGIHFEGTGVLQILESDIIGNTANYGGGIYAGATGSDAELIISAGTTISSNTALYNGGGLFIGGPLEMTMSEPNTLIAFNTALGVDGVSGHGGGLEVVGPAIAYIGSPGAFGLGTIFGNSARYGGGLSIEGSSNDDNNALVKLFTTDPLNPVAVQSNTASIHGGGIYLQPYEGVFDSSRATLCAQDFRIEDNLAEDGSGIYADYQSFAGAYGGSDVRLNQTECQHAGAVACVAGAHCNSVSGNGTSTGAGDPTDGATIRVTGDGRLVASRLAMRGNTGGRAIRASDSWTEIASCLLVDNQLSQQLILSDGDINDGIYNAYLTIEGCTFANNGIVSTDVIRAEDNLDLSDSIIDQAGNLALAWGGDAANLHVSYVLASNTASLPADPTIVQASPVFVDPANGDYHQSMASLGVDFAPPITGDDRDLDNQPRDQNLPGAPDLFGVRDVGAYERQRQPFDCGAADTIFCNGFEQ